MGSSDISSSPISIYGAGVITIVFFSNNATAVVMTPAVFAAHESGEIGKATAEGDLAETQFILIDKEHCPPDHDLGRTLLIRHMTTDDAFFRPLIRCYRADRAKRGGETEVT